MNRASEARGARFPGATVFAVFATLAACAPEDARDAPSGMGGAMPAGAAGTGGVMPTSSGGAGGTSSSGGGAGGGEDPSGTCKTVTALTPCGKNPNPCGIHSGYPGDEYCMPPPPAGKGMQVHFGPKDYANPEEVAKFVLKPGKEVSDYWVVKQHLSLNSSLSVASAFSKKECDTWDTANAASPY